MDEPDRNKNFVKVSKCNKKEGEVKKGHRVKKKEKKEVYQQDLYKFQSLPRESFSPDSGGSVKPRTAMEAMSTQGTIKLKK
jgi:hypothetical protein